MNSDMPQFRQTIEELVNERHRLVHEVSSTDWDIKKLELCFSSVFKFLKSFGDMIRANR